MTVQKSASITHLLVTGTRLADVMDYGALLGTAFKQVTLAESPSPFLRAQRASHDQSLVAVVLWRRGDEQPPPCRLERLLIVDLDGTMPDTGTNCGAPRVLAGTTPETLRAVALRLIGLTA